MKSTAICVVVSCLALCVHASGQGGIITTVAGNGTNGQSGDGGPATSASLYLDFAFDYLPGITVDASGNLFFVDEGGNSVRKVSGGIINTVINPSSVFSAGVAADAKGNLFITDYMGARILELSTNGSLTTVAGNGNQGFSGDGGPATAAALSSPAGIAADASGNLFFAELGNVRIRKVSANGIITTIAGNGNTGFSGDGGPATAASLNFNSIVVGVAVDASGNVFFADSANNRIRKVSAGGIITTVAGNGTAGFSGDGGAATEAEMFEPIGVGVDASGDLFFADLVNNRIRKVSATGMMTTVAGSGAFGDCGFSGDGGPATSAVLCGPSGVALDASGNLFIADTGNNRIRKVSATGSTVVPAPSINAGGIVPVDSTVPIIQAGEWVSIFGKNLSSATVTWNGNFPTSLGQTSVRIGGNPAYLSFVSPTQINVQAPDDTATGPVPVVVTTVSGAVTSIVTLARFAPAFLLFDSKHVAGIIPRSDGSGAYGGGTYDILGPTGNSLGYVTVAAKAGDTVELFALGLGPTDPVVAAGSAFSSSAPTTNLVNLLINNVSTSPTFAGLSGAGLYQINLTVPEGLGTGDVSLVATVGGAQTPSGVVISLQ